MATTTKPKIKDLFNPITNPSGGMTTAMSTAMMNNPQPQNASVMALRQMYGAKPAPYAQPKPIVMPPMPAPGPMSMIPRPVQGPVAPTSSGVGGSLSQAGGFTPSSSSAPATMPAPTPAAAPAAVPPQYMNPDGTMKTPEQVAADIALTLKNQNGNPDVPTLAGNQFGGGGKTAEQLQAETMQLNNTRNDIAVGENDPYKVAANSGVAYSPAELKAIEQAYAGVYDPALTTAFAKLEKKQAEDAAAAEAKTRQDEMRLQSELDANAPFTLGQDQVRYGADGKPLAVGLSSDLGSGIGTGSYMPGSNPTVDSFIKGIQAGTYKPSDIPDEYKALVAQGMAATKPAISNSSTETISVIDALLNDSKIGRISGTSGMIPIFGGADATSATNLAKQLFGMLSLENRDQLKGSGAISDFEFRVLRDSASALGIKDNGTTNLPDEEFKKELKKMKLKLFVGPTELTDDELLYLQDTKGYAPEEIRAYSQQQYFPNVGNTTVSTNQGNRPQRNNNPGNVKAGGLSDSLAIGQDEQGHLIFPDAQTGFQAMKADIGAKINGGSRWMAANPTIAQLGKVYAEDSNWPNSVARILGVTPDTPTKNIPLDQLIEAIAKQEGFYA